MTTVGLIIGLPMLAGLPMQIAGGAIADRFGRRGVLILGICASIVLFEGLALAGRLWQVVVVITIEAAFGWAMFFTANNAMLADLTSLPKRAEAYSISRVAANAGQAAGPLAGGLLLGAGLRYRLLFASGGAVCGLFLLLVLARIKESRPAVPAGAVGIGSTLAGYRVVLADRRFLAFCGIALLPLYGFGQIYVTLPVMLRNVVGLAPPPGACWRHSMPAAASSSSIPSCGALRSYNKLGVLAVASACIGAAWRVPPSLPRASAPPPASCSSPSARCSSRRSLRPWSRRWRRRPCGAATWGPGRWSGWGAPPWGRPSVAWPWTAWGAAAPIW